MRKLFLPVLCLIIVSTLLEAGNSTISYSTAQSTQIQTKLIPLYNKRQCFTFGQVASCTSANLVTGGCVTITVKTVVVQSCTIFTQDATGEQAFLQEQLNQKLTGLLQELSVSDAADFCTSFKALSGANQNTICSSLGLSNGCAPCS